MSALRRILETLVEIVVRSSRGSEVTPSDLERASPDRDSAAQAGRRENVSSSPPSRTPTPARATSGAGDEIRSWVNSWKGVPYRMGGTDRSGIDCSAFVRAMYGSVFNCSLPRTSNDQAQQGEKVSRGDLEPGDLVFFQISERTRHVGAYIGSGRFGHASTSKGPVVSSLDSDYWRKRYWTARRVI